MTLSLPELSLVVLVGPSGAGKSTFARRHFGPFEVVSSDRCREMVSNDENDQAVTDEAFGLLHDILHRRLRLGRLTVVDATNVRKEDRATLVRIAREHHVLPVAVVFDLPEDMCHERNRERADRDFGPHVVRNQKAAMRRGGIRGKSRGKGLRREGFRQVYVLHEPSEVEAATVERQPLWNDRKHLRGPFDIFGDVHGCAEELEALLGELGYRITSAEDREDELGVRVTPPEGRQAVFVGDLVDRGPDTPRVLQLVMSMVADGVAHCVPGNHDVKLVRALRGKNVQLKHGLAESLEQLAAEPDELRGQAADFLDGLVSHLVFDDGRLVVAHAGLKEEMHGRGSGQVREFCLYGDTTGETDEHGLPVRLDWAADYRGEAMVVYGHTPVAEPAWLNHTINLDTGCVFGGKLTALRYPEGELVSVPAKQTYAESPKPFLPPEDGAEPLTIQQQHDDTLDLAEAMGKRIIDTPLVRNITVREENAAAALEVISRFAVDLKWLIHLPPTMSPCATSDRPDYLEHPDEAFAYFKREGVERVICERKHMGSRAIVVVCRDEGVARDRFGIAEQEAAPGSGGIIYTRTGRRFFNDASLEAGLLQRVRGAATAAGLWDELDTGWLCLDCELMPWSAKAQELITSQYAAVGAAGRHALAAAVETLEQAAVRLPGIPGAAALLEDFRGRRAMLDAYTQAYRGYCWPVDSLDDLKLAPFHLLASEGAVHADKPHDWHLSIARRLADADESSASASTPGAGGAFPSGGVLMVTDHREVDLDDEQSVAAAVDWWESLTDGGGEGMVVKPLDFTPGRGRKGLTQPAVKCRGREYLRIIYGPEYTRPDNLDRLRQRGLGRKRSLAVREFALGIESLERFVGREPLRRVHECVFAVLALESEPVDPRL